MWIDKNSGETAANLETRLTNAGAKVQISKQDSTSIAYSSSGVTLRQKESETVYEFRGLTQAAAELLATIHTDTTATTTYYKTVGTDTATASITTGTRATYVANRANEADGWKVTKTETTYSAYDNPTDNGWTTSQSGDVLTAAGVEVPVSQDRTATWQFGTDNTISSIVTSTVIEYRRLTEAGKNAYLAQATNGATIKCHNYCCNTGASSNPYMVSAWCYFNDGTDVMVSARYVSAEEGWTVTKTTKVYSFTPSGGRKPTNNGANGTVGWYLDD